MDTPYMAGLITGHIIAIFIPIIIIIYAINTRKDREEQSRFFRDYFRSHKKQFENRFFAIQSRWIELGLEYVPYSNKIFIYGSCENALYFNVFYLIDGTVVRKHQVKSEGGHVCDVSAGRQRTLLDNGLEELKKMYLLFQEYKREMPKGIKLVYDVNAKTYDTDFSYSKKSVNANSTGESRFDKWYEEIQGEYNRGHDK